MPELKNIGTERLLAEIIRRRGVAVGPRETVFCEPHFITTIGIGDDDYASIYIAASSLAELTKRTNVKPTMKG